VQSTDTTYEALTRRARGMRALTRGVDLECARLPRDSEDAEDPHIHLQAYTDHQIISRLRECSRRSLPFADGPPSSCAPQLRSSLSRHSLHTSALIIFTSSSDISLVSWSLVCLSRLHSTMSQLVGHLQPAHTDAAQAHHRDHTHMQAIASSTMNTIYPAPAASHATNGAAAAAEANGKPPIAPVAATHIRGGSALPPPCGAPSSGAVVPLLAVSSRSRYKTFVLSNGVFEVEQRYAIKEVIGQGAYGVVWYVRERRQHLARETKYHMHNHDRENGNL
jgi:hypothetical protein